MKKSHTCHILFPAVVEVLMHVYAFSHFTRCGFLFITFAALGTVNIRGAHYDCSLKHRAEGSHLNLSFHLQQFEVILPITFANLSVSKRFWQQNLKQIFGAGCFQKYDYSLLTFKF